jgi:S1-C subfamily serine protease
MAADQWFYRLDNKQLGPVDYESLQQLAKAGVVARTTFVWKEGLPEWIPASTVRGIFTVPPPAPSSPVVTAPGAKEDFVVLTRANLRPRKNKAEAAESSKGSGTSKRHAATSAPPGNSRLYMAGAAAIVALGLGLVIHHSLSNTPAALPGKETRPSTSSSASPNPVKQLSPELAREEKLAAYDRAAAEDSKPQLPLPELQRRLDELADLSDLAVYQSEILKRRKALQQLKESRANTLVEALGKSAVEKADASDFQGALQELAKLPKELEATDAGIRTLFFRRKVDEIAQSKLKALDATAVKLATGHDVDGALRLYAPLAHLNPSLERVVAQRQIEIRDIASVGLNPGSETALSLSPAQQFLTADVYVKCAGMVEKLGTAVKDAVGGSPEAALYQCDLTHYPRSAVFYYVHALAEIRLGNMTEALWDKDQAYRTSRPSPDFQSRLECLDIRLALEQQMDEAKANELLRKSQQLVDASPKNAETYFTRGICLCRLLSLDPQRNEADSLIQNAKDSFNTAAQLDAAYNAFAVAPDPYAYSGPSGNPYVESVVLITSKDNQESRLGTGFVVGNSAHTAYIITNYHVIDGAKHLHVRFRIPFVGSLSQRETAEVKILASDPRVDLALLEIPVEHALKVLAFRNTTSGLQVPMKVTLIGHPKGLDYSVLSGELSNLNREVGGMRYLQVNANVEPGMSGGPVIDSLGNVVGVTVMKYQDIEGQGLAILSERVRDICGKAGVELTLNDGAAAPPNLPAERAVAAGNIAPPSRPLATQSKVKDDTQRGEFVLPFKERGPLSAVKEQARRLHATDIPEDYDVSQESFKMYVPEDYDKSGGYGLIVWMDTYADPILPEDFKSVLQKRGLLWVSPKNCDDDRKTGGYRMGLPLDAVFNVARHYSLDEKRIYVLGLGRGAETATRLSLLYPDVFTGGVFVLSCDRFKDVPGTQSNQSWRATFTPDSQLFTQARQHGRFVLVAGEKSSSRDMMKSAFANLFTPAQFSNATYIEVPGLTDRIPATSWIEQAIETLDTPMMPSVQQAYVAATALEAQGKLSEAFAAYELVLKHGLFVPEVCEKARAKYQALQSKKDSQLQDAKNAIKEQRLADAKSILDSVIKGFESTKPGEATELLRKLVQSPAFDKSMREKEAETALNNVLQSSGQDLVKQFDALKLVAEKYPECAAGADARKRFQAMRADHDKASKIDAAHDGK